MMSIPSKHLRASEHLAIRVSVDRATKHNPSISEHPVSRLPYAAGFRYEQVPTEQRSGFRGSGFRQTGFHEQASDEQAADDLHGGKGNISTGSTRALMLADGQTCA